MRTAPLLFAIFCIISFPLCFTAIADNGQDSGRLSVVVPSTGEKAYSIAGEAFVTMWEQVTGLKPSLCTLQKDKNLVPEGNVILIGSDAVNPLVHELIRSGKVESLGIVYGADNYRILSLEREGRTLLILAGGCGRSTLYAVYDFFRRQAGIEYFWDGDVVPHVSRILISGVDVNEKPRFDYRGLRYFAHRGLHRFQAEHWDLEDWKKEIDWMIKKRFNMFMLRTGIDDLFQRAFPGDVPYPPVDRQDPDAKQRSFDDRTSFWQLKYRGELRKQVLQYARDRGLLHPEDVGTITHWYSHTPGSFYRSFPDFPVIRDQRSGYSLPTQAIWDIGSQRAWDAYWKLTETHIREFGGGSPVLFHTIGMAERTFGKTDRENLQSKFYVYRKTQQQLRKHYPDVPLLIASWDLFKWGWKNENVQELLGEFDPKRTILLDYTADKDDKVTYRDWDVYQKFPWIFGMFHSHEKNSDIHGDYSILTPRLKEAAADDKCKGLVTWSENSHTDTYMLEFLGNNSWAPLTLDTRSATEHFCNARYPSELSTPMKKIWNSFLMVSQTMHWGYEDILYREPQFRLLTSGFFLNVTPDLLKKLEMENRELTAGLTAAPAILSELAGMAGKWYHHPFWHRDALDIARTIASRACFTSLSYGICRMEAWRNRQSAAEEIQQIARLSKELMEVMSRLLSLSDDYSMAASLNKLSEAKPLNGISPLINPHAEQTLKGNSENSYCRSHQYELVQFVYRPEMEVYWDYVLKKVRSGNREPWKQPALFGEQEKIIVDRFYEMPLTGMAPTEVRDANRMTQILIRLERAVENLLEKMKA